MTYTHFSVEEREVIQYGIWKKRSIRDIARELGRAPSSVSREIKKNLPHERYQYTSRLANERAHEHRTHRGREEHLKNDITRTYVKEKLKAGYAPEQIAGRLPIDHPRHTISHEAIYQYIYYQIHETRTWVRETGM